jgi:hypothetical protein
VITQLSDTGAMSIRSLLCLAALFPLLAQAQDKVHMRVFVNGSAVGDNSYELAPDGSFTSKSTLDLGTMKMAGVVTGHFKKGKLADSTSEVDGPGGKSKVVYAKGRVEATSGGKTGGGPWQDKTGMLGANLHPQFWTPSSTRQFSYQVGQFHRLLRRRWRSPSR